MLIGESVDESLALQTRQKRRIPNEFRALDKHPDTLAELARMFGVSHPFARLVCSSALYNCGGLVFGSRRVWIEPEEFLRILEDDGYELITDSPSPGDIVLYGTSLDPEGIAHVGVVHHAPVASSPQADHEILVRSKWGDAGEYVHEMRDVPEQFGQPLETRRFRSCP